MVAFKKGEWVLVNGRFKWVGYITSVSHTTEECEVRVIKRVNGKDFTAEQVLIDVDFEDMKLMDNRLEEDHLYQLIDLALDTNDKEWFNEIQSMLPKSEGVSL
ncbi:hypothetical protein ABW02_15165 [Niallia circulans]|uniref:IDEAL domain-containing protein n=1 Tax=Niallia circulans TaxID=1397 RepID=A0A0J1III3_NIACI|nr:IDEAL domain-containing protein [Niallia circulans]KLV25707.1 hypothetical protein ABW02_15165 [Niallia circulans]